jgi:hypothetical protein
MKTFQPLLIIAVLGHAALQASVAAVNSTTQSSRYTCANVRCASGTQCILQQVQCVKAPCSPVPACVPLPTTPRTGDCEPGLCDDSETCELQTVQCIRAPCPPVSTCVPQVVTSETCTKTCGQFQRCFLYRSKPYCADVCSASRCGQNQRCEMESVQCLVAPCPRVAKCITV